METGNDDSAVLTERTIAATPAEVFAAFEEPERLALWWGPTGFTNTFEAFEFVPGGRWKFAMHGPNGANFPNECVFREIEPAARIVLDHVVKPLYTLTVSLTERDGQTHLTWLQDFGSQQANDKMRPLSATANEQVLDRLETVLGGGKPS